MIVVLYHDPYTSHLLMSVLIDIKVFHVIIINDYLVMRGIIITYDVEKY